MNFSSMNDSAILAVVGGRIRQERLNQNLTQATLAEISGTARIVVQRVEGGKGCSLRSLIRLMRALGKLDQMDTLLPDPGVSPLALARFAGRVRKQASGNRGRRAGPGRES
jgi:transcriptional regulator with XRE-family HTH domain